jgi:hypothetical protein
MAFQIVQVQSGQLALADADGNILGIIDDAGVKKLATASRLHDGSGFYKAALETGGNLASIKTKTDNIPSDPAKESGKLTSLETLLTAIKDTAGIKKITDMVSANIAQWIGSTAPTVGQKGMADSIPVVLPNNQTAIPVTVVGSSDIANLVTDYLKTSGGAYNMKVNGSVTPVVYNFVADAIKDIEVYELRFVFSAASFNWSGIGFGKNATAGLTNGILVEMTVNNGVAIALNNIKINEDFLRTFGEVPVVDSAGSTVVMVSSYRFAPGSLQLKAGSADKVKVTIRDDLTGGGLGVNYLAATFFGDKAL